MSNSLFTGLVIRLSQNLARTLARRTREGHRRSLSRPQPAGNREALRVRKRRHVADEVHLRNLENIERVEARHVTFLDVTFLAEEQQNAAPLGTPIWGHVDH